MKIGKRAWSQMTSIYIKHIDKHSIFFFFLQLLCSIFRNTFSYKYSRGKKTNPRPRKRHVQNHYFNPSN